MRPRIVIGAGFGDEGKGNTTSFLVSQEQNPLVVRFNGGHQAGHTVVFNGKRHVFSSFGSGTLQGAATFISRFCTIYPFAIFNEYETLQKLGITPILFIDPLCPVTTPFDIINNQAQELIKKHGTVGVGFGATIERHEAQYKIFAQDLQFPDVLRMKLLEYQTYFRQRSTYSTSEYKQVEEQFLNQAEIFQKLDGIEIRRPDIHSHSRVIFEGAQGILLDQNFGFFPYVTRSNTTCKNAMRLIDEWNLEKWPEVYYVTRSYQTRHGRGPMTNEGLLPALINNKDETNVNGIWQGKLRTGLLDLDLLRYAIKCDVNLFPHNIHNLVITCIDQTGMPFIATSNKETCQITAKGMANSFSFVAFIQLLTNVSPEYTTFVNH